MKNIALKASSLVTAVLLSVIILLVVPGTYEHPLATIINKVHLIESTPAPRIILIGGSEVLVGVNSEMLHRRFGCEVVNMAVYGGFGIRDMLHLAGPHIRRGDVVIITAEYLAMKTDFYSDSDSMKWVLLLSPRYALERLYLGRGRLASLVGDLSDIIFCKIEGMWGELWSGRNPFSDGAAAYTRRSNRYGDLIKNWAYVPGEKLEGRGSVYPRFTVGEGVIRALNDFSALASARGAVVYFGFPAYPKEEYERNREVIGAMVRQCGRELTFPLLGAPEDNLHPYDHFSNAVHHLRFEARDLRTATLIKRLEGVAVPCAGAAGRR